MKMLQVSEVVKKVTEYALYCIKIKNYIKILIEYCGVQETQMSIDQVNPIIICIICSYLAVDVGVSLIVARTALGDKSE